MREIGGHIYRSGHLLVCISRMYVPFVEYCAIDQCLYARVYVQCCMYVHVVSKCNRVVGSKKTAVFFFQMLITFFFVARWGLSPPNLKSVAVGDL